MDKVKEFVIKYKIQLAIFIIAFILGSASTSAGSKTQPMIIEKPIIQTKEVTKEVLPANFQKQLDACQAVIALDNEALTIAANVDTAFSDSITAMMNNDVAKINNITAQINGYKAQLDKIAPQKQTIIGTCVPSSLQ
jgi:hypothetical protein